MFKNTISKQITHSIHFKEGLLNWKMQRLIMIRRDPPNQRDLGIPRSRMQMEHMVLGDLPPILVGRLLQVSLGEQPMEEPRRGILLPHMIIKLQPQLHTHRKQLMIRDHIIFLRMKWLPPQLRIRLLLHPHLHLVTVVMLQVMQCRAIHANHTYKLA